MINSSSISRRSFLAGAAAFPWICGNSALGRAVAESEPKREPLLDLHVHLFGVGEGGTGCRMAKSITAGFQFRLLVSLLGLRKEGKTLDGEYERILADMVENSGFDAVAILGQDAVYDATGKPDWTRTSFYVPNDYVFEVVGRHAEKMLPCPSLNPDRADAMDELARCRERGARLFKIHPPTQGVDVGQGKHKPFFRRAAELGMIVLVHTGHEHSAPVIDKALASPRRLELALDQCCTVVACHAGTGWASDSPDQLPEFAALVKRYPKLWGDTSVLGTAGRVRDFMRLLEDPTVRERLLHGSDFPFPPSPLSFTEQIGEPAVRRIAREPNWLKKDLDLKEALGIGLASARRGYALVKA